MPNGIDTLWANLVAFLPNLLVAILILVVGWLIAYFVSKLVENLLHRTTLDDRVAGMLRGGNPDRIPVERWISRFVFWVIMLFAIVAFLSRLNLGVISTPLNDLLAQFLAFLPNLLAALALLVVAWVVATALRMLIVRVVSASGFSRRVTESANMEVDARDRNNIGQTIGNVVYWLVFLLFLPAILGALNLQGILAPVQAMVNDVLGVLPNIFGAALVLVAGYLVARIIRQIVTNLLAGMGIDRFGQRATGTSATTTAEGSQIRLSNIIGTIVFVLILVPIAIAALNILNIPAISQPAAAMLTNFLNALPNIFAAFLLLALGYFIARMVGSFVATLLAGIGFNRLFTWLGIPAMDTTAAPRRSPEDAARYAAQQAAEGTSPGEAQPLRTTPSEVAGYLVTVAILLFAAIEASNLLGFTTLATLISGFMVAAVNILFGLVIFALGLFLANQAYKAIRGMSMEQAPVLAPAARIAIIIFAAALALRQMGIASSIVNLAFGLLLGAVAVAVAIAFGLGGRDVAARMLENWRQEMRVDMYQSSPIPMTGDQGSQPGDQSSSQGGQTPPGEEPPSSGPDLNTPQLPSE